MKTLNKKYMDVIEKSIKEDERKKKITKSKYLIAAIIGVEIYGILAMLNSADKTNGESRVFIACAVLLVIIAQIGLLMVVSDQLDEYTITKLKYVMSLLENEDADVISKGGEHTFTIKARVPRENVKLRLNENDWAGSSDMYLKYDGIDGTELRYKVMNSDDLKEKMIEPQSFTEVIEVYVENENVQRASLMQN